MIAYTAEASPEEAARLRTAGFDSVVAKPAEPGQPLTGVADAVALAPTLEAMQGREGAG